MTRVLNPIVSESYMKGYIKDEGLIKPEGNIELTENGENINVAAYATATVNVSGGGDTIPKLHIKFNNEYAEPVIPFGNNQAFNRLVSNGIGNSIVMVEKGTSVEADFLYIYADNLYTGFDTPTTGIEITNLVNCTVDTEGSISYITITDPSLDASAEISAAAPK